MTFTLEDIVNASKKRRKVDAIAEAFKERPYENIAPELVEIDKSKKAFDEMGIDANQTIELTPEQKYAIIGNMQGRYQNEIIEGVQENYTEVLNRVATSDKGLQRIVGLLSQIKPVSSGNANTEDKIYSAHEKAYKTFAKADSNPEEVFNKVMDKYKDTAAGMAIMFLVQKHPDLIKHIAEYQKVRAINALAEEVKDAGVGEGYMQSVYAAADDKTKKTIAYNLGKAFAEL